MISCGNVKRLELDNVFFSEIIWFIVILEALSVLYLLKDWFHHMEVSIFVSRISCLWKVGPEMRRAKIETWKHFQNLQHNLLDCCVQSKWDFKGSETAIRKLPFCRTQVIITPQLTISPLAKLVITDIIKWLFESNLILAILRAL